MTAENLMGLAGLILALIGLVVGARGADLTRRVLARDDQSDLVIDALAWVDRLVFRRRSGA